VDKSKKDSRDDSGVEDFTLEPVLSIKDGTWEVKHAIPSPGDQIVFRGKYGIQNVGVSTGNLECEDYWHIPYRAEIYVDGKRRWISCSNIIGIVRGS
jgi:hypothetical protein